MSPWEFKIGQLVGYRPRGEKWRARVTAVEYAGKCFMAEIPVVDESGQPIRYEDPPSFVSPIIDYENYYLVEDVNGKATEPWLAARLDHEDPAGAWKAFVERIGLKEPYYQALATVMEKWAGEGRRGEFLEDLLVLLHAAWRAGAAIENAECAKLLEARCRSLGPACTGECTHLGDAQAIRERMEP
jgi:hypothetical protein